MGRRSINTTKSGKYMNPTDQARKEARKKELKKNKKQRQMVRAAVLKGKDPLQLIAEMEKIDQMEYNVLQPPPLNEKVLKDKRKKLKDTFERVLKLYNKEDPDRWSELKRLESEYERSRAGLVAYFESVRHAQQVTVDEIPLPLPLPSLMQTDPSLAVIIGTEEEDPTTQIPLPADLPLPPSLLPPTAPIQAAIASSLATAFPNLPPGIGPSLPVQGILKKTSAYSHVLPPGKKPPGVPVGPPPELSDDEEEEEEEEKEEEIEKEASANEAEGSTEKGPSRTRVIRFADAVGDEGKASTEQMEVDEAVPRKGSKEDEDDGKNERGDKGAEESDEEDVQPVAPKPTSLQQKMLQMAGQDIDEFMREMEEVHRRREMDRQADLNTRISRIGEDEEEASAKRVEQTRMQQQPSMPAPTSQPPPMPMQQQQQAIQQSQLMHQQMQQMQMGPPQPLGIPRPPPPPPLALMNQPPPQLQQMGGQQQGPPMGMPPPPLMLFRGPPGIRLPPGPPPGIPPPPPRNIIGGIRLPPGPPPGMPPRMLRPPTSLPPPPHQVPQVAPPHPPLIPPLVGGANPNVLSAAPQLIGRRDGLSGVGDVGHDKSQGSGATIEAKPQIRNLSADVTRFLPTALRVRREDKKRKDGKPSNLIPESKPESIVVSGKPMTNAAAPQTKDDAYLQFMKEMEGLL
ncbi:WW domain-binding protein 11 [Ischnura elegans]|uniref:WW domain-binding protein 11 n=1 Tax=Ischnura elegans TaxID=197161 RepID=UPI001ED8BA32|nr:WW domain-binding protein 11 [Ischnura elegans]